MYLTITEHLSCISRVDFHIGNIIFMSTKGSIMNLSVRKINALSLGLFLLLPINAQANESPSETNTAFLVSIQDDKGNHLCNGSYIGNNQILSQGSCHYASPISPVAPPPIDPIIISPPIDPIITPIPIDPITGSPIISATENLTLDDTWSDQLGSGVLTGSIDDSLSCPGTGIGYFTTPFQAVFLLPDGNSEPIPLSTVETVRYQHPISTSDSIYIVDSVPEEAIAIKLASKIQIDELLENNTTKFSLIGKYVNWSSSEIAIKDYQAQPPSLCDTPYQNEYAPTLCLKPIEIDECFQKQGVIGAAILATTNDGQQLLVGMKKDITDHKGFTNISRVTDWSNLLALKKQGLSVATAYEVGRQAIHTRNKLTLKIKNNSDEKIFTLDSFKIDKRQVFTLNKNNCGTLMPGDACSVVIKSKIHHPLIYTDKLVFNSNQGNSAIFLGVDGYSDQPIEGSRKSIWHITGWKKSNIGRQGGIYTNDSFSSRAIIELNTYMTGPNTVHITYKTVDDKPDALILFSGRRSLDYGMYGYTTLKSIPGTNGHWITEEINIDEPGTHSLTIMRGSGLTPGADVEISDICLESCN